MFIKPLRSMVGDFGSLKRNQPKEVPDHIGQRLVDRGRAVLYTPPGAEAGKTPSENPQGSPAGGPDGPAKQSSSSPAGRAPRKSRSKKQGAAPGS